jgi:hypothetical protein
LREERGEGGLPSPITRELKVLSFERVKRG